VARNPANLVLLPAAQVQVGADVIHSKIKFTSALSGQTDQTEGPWKLLPYAFASMPLTKNPGARPRRRRAVRAVHGLEQGRPVPLHGADLRRAAACSTSTRRCRPSSATTFCVGLGADIYVSDIELRQYAAWSQVAGPGAPDGLEKLTGSGVGLGGNAALTWLVTDDQRLALTYRSPVKVKLRWPPPGGQHPGADAAARAAARGLQHLHHVPRHGRPRLQLQACRPAESGSDVEWIEFSPL